MLESQFGYRLRVNRVSACAPGRVELLGNHTDYNRGVVLAAAIDRGITVAGSQRADGRVRLYSHTLERTCETSLDQLQRRAGDGWANYPLGVVHELRQAGFNVAGFEAELDGDLPLGGGLSSSAAVEVATAYFLVKLQGLDVPPREIARLCRKAENDFVGVASGLLDQITSVFGRRDCAVFLDCASEEVRTIEFPRDVALVIADSGTKHSLLQSQYNQRRAECAAAAAALGVESLRNVSMEQLAASDLEPLLRRRAAHVVGENGRVFAALQSLADADAREIGVLMNASHESSRTNFENSTPELDELVRIARSLDGVFGARLTGGGFGGSTVTLVASAKAADAAQQIDEQFLARTGRDAHAFVCRIADGAEIVNQQN